VTKNARPVVLILRALGLGDLLTALPALRALHDAYPDHRRVLAAPAYLAPLGLHTGAIDDVVAAAPLAPLDLDIAPHIAVNLHGRGPESHRILMATRPGRLIAFAHPVLPHTDGGPRWRPHEHEIARWCRMLEESGIPADSSQVDLGAPPRSIPAEAMGATIVHPGAGSQARRWPAERWAAVARTEAAAGRDVLITGAADERALALRVARLAGMDEGAVLAGRTDVMDLAAVVAAAGRVLCADTGIAHLATALGTPSVVLFGPTSPAEWGPPPARDRHRVLWAGKTGDPHASHVDDGLLKLRVSDVIEACRSLDLAQTGGRS
jgi:ADP-heptose:LPS heptosyltransferase